MRILGEAAVQRLDSEAIAGTEQHVAAKVVDHERPHPVQPVQAARTPGAVCVQQYFGISGGLERIAQLGKFLAQLDVVVDLAIEGDDAVSIGRNHGLMARW